MKKKLLYLILPFIFTTSLCAQEISKIRDIYSIPVGTTVTVQGVINCPDYGFNHGQFFVQDSTAGVNIFFNNVGGKVGAITDYDEGDTVLISGRTEIFGRFLEILPHTIDLIAVGTEIPAPIQISGNDIQVESPYQGMRVEIADVRLSNPTQRPTTSQTSGSDLSVPATVGNSKEIFIRIDRAFLDGSDIPDEPFTLRGIFSRFNDDIQIFPFYKTDIFQATTTNTFEALKLGNTLKIYPNPVKDQITIEVLPQAGTVDQVTLYDLIGRNIAQWNHLSAKNTTLTLAVPTSLNKGNYFISILTENGIRSSKTVVLK